MAEPPDPASDDDIGLQPGRQSGGAPRWAKAFGILGLVLVVLFVVLLVSGGANHGPGRHSSSGGAASQAPTAGSVIDSGGPADHARRRRGHGADAQ